MLFWSYIYKIDNNLIFMLNENLRNIINFIFYLFYCLLFKIVCEFILKNWKPGSNFDGFWSMGLLVRGRNFRMLLWLIHGIFTSPRPIDTLFIFYCACSLGLLWYWKLRGIICVIWEYCILWVVSLLIVNYKNKFRIFSILFNF